MAKKADSFYKDGKRSKVWLKIKREKPQVAIIAGYTEPKEGRKYFGALILGIYKEDRLTYIGHVGGGFNDLKLKELGETLTKLVVEKSPFPEKIETNTPAKWVEPNLVCEIKFSEWTKDGIIRQPVFLGLREDLDPREAVLEVSQTKETILLEKEEPEEIVIKDHTIKISNPEKIFWPKEEYSKKGLIDYYQNIASCIMPYLKGRPESLNRYPDGILGEHFYQKNFDESDLPEWVKKKRIKSESEEINYLICENEETLIYMINLGCIELNPWHSRIDNLDHPDYMVIDLDPVQIDFRYVVRAAFAVKKVLDKAKIPSYCKTSGATGIHIYVPLGANYSYDQSKNFAKIIAHLAHRLEPNFTSVERSTSKREKKVYLDYLQNIQGQTLAAPYCVRPVPGALVSTPLRWEELTEKIKPELFNIKTVIPRIQKTGDLWKGLLDSKIDLKKSLENLSL